MAAEFYISEPIKDIINEVATVLVPQIVLLEPDSDIKKEVYQLLENITDTRNIVQGENGTNYGATFPHLTRSVGHIINLYELLLKKNICIEGNYQS